MNPAPQKLACYVRVSTTSQDYASQMHAMKEFCRRHKWRVPVKAMTFAEKESGAKAKRTRLDMLLQQCRDGHVDTILCYRLDRIGRSFVHLVNLLAELERLKIRVIGISDNLDTAENSAAMNHFRRTMASASEYERELRAERTREGLAAARSRGRIGGRQPGRTAANEKKVARARELLAAQRNGKALSLRKVAERVGLNPGYLSRALKS